MVSKRKVHSFAVFTVLYFTTSMSDTNISFLALCVFLPISFLIFLKLFIRPRPVKIPIMSCHVFITGGSSGVGLALARQAVVEGARVTILALDNLEEAMKSI